ncbi:hypothetical protein BKA70DRAFT_1476449 [Coprinopsis sp. MPI-PUGE-AT-0042]|nr:hypothetical protein BKA70DRAFT_1476449 [Coprinopsis sp. MPI-PUGE-AT-0042]
MYALFSFSQGNAKSASTSTFLTALVANAAAFGIQLAIFTILRPYFKAIYEPRTYVPPPDDHSKRIQPLTGGKRILSNLFWPIAVATADYRHIIKANGLDAYFYVRFLRLMVKILLPIWLFLGLVNIDERVVDPPAEGESADGRGGLNRFTFGNIGPYQQSRLWAHLLCAWFFTLWILWNLKQEMATFVVTRQRHLTEKEHSRSVQAHTILITGIPDSYLSPARLRELFKDLPGGVNKIWINRNLKELPDIYDRRADASNKLEKAETTTTGMNGSGDSLVVDGPLRTPSITESSVARAEDFVPANKRPTHKLGFLGLFGEKEIAECTALLAEGRKKIRESDEKLKGEDAEDALSGAAVDEYGNPITEEGRIRAFEEDGTLDVQGALTGISGKVKNGVVGGVKGAVGGVKGAGGKVMSVGGKVVQGVTGKGGPDEYAPLSSAFVTFNKQISAHLALQALPHHKPYRMGARYVEIAPSDVIWSNLGLNPYEQKIRTTISYAATAGLILLWAFPVAFVGVISNVQTLCKTVSFLSWICRIRDPVPGIISGILPPVLLAVLMMLLPIILRLLARFEGIPRYTGLELSLMTRFFLFQVLHSFLIVTLSSGIIASVEKLANNPTSIPGTLAENLPKASIFFLTYIVLQGLTATAGGFLQIVPLVIYYVKLVILGSTPRSVYNIKYTPRQVAWGTLFPSTTLLVVITLSYAIIAPIITGLAVATFFLFYMLYKFLFLYVFQQDLKTDTGGLFYPKALQHIFVGLYLQEICLAALFFLARDASKSASCIPQGALMIVLIVVTAGFHAILNNSYGPLLVALPLSLQNRLGDSVVIEDAEDIGSEDGFGEGNATPKTVSSEQQERTRQGLLVSEEPRTAEDDSENRKDQKIAQKQNQAEINELAKYGFAHPAASRPQRTIWIPTDELGLSQREVEETRKAGVDVSSRDAIMNHKGKVDVAGAPPGYSGL